VPQLVLSLAQVVGRESCPSDTPVTRLACEVGEGADMHCQVGNLSLSNAVVYDWLDEVL